MVPSTLKTPPSCYSFIGILSLHPQPLANTDLFSITVGLSFETGFFLSSYCLRFIQVVVCINSLSFLLLSSDASYGIPQLVHPFTH